MGTTIYKTVLHLFAILLLLVTIAFLLGFFGFALYAVISMFNTGVDSSLVSNLFKASMVCFVCFVVAGAISFLTELLAQ